MDEVAFGGTFAHVTNRFSVPDSQDLRRPDSSNELRVVLTRLFRRRAVFASVFIAVVVSVAVFTVMAPVVYTSTATVRVGDQSQDGVFSQQSRWTDPRREVETQRAIIESPQVEDLVRSKLSPESFNLIHEVIVTSARNADLIGISVTSVNAEVSAQVASVWAEQYVELRREQTAGWLKGMEDELRLRAAESQLRISEIDADLLNAPENTKAVLVAQREALQGQFLQFTQRADELAVEGQVRRGGVSVVAQAVVPTVPSAPDVQRNAVLGVLAALVLAFAAAYARELLDDRVRGEDDLSLLPSVPPLLGAVPDVRAWRRRRSSAGLLSFGDPHAEAFRQLRIALEFADFERQHKRIAFVSPLPGEGKSALIANLAVAMARSGKKVVLVDLDLRKSRQRQLFKLEPGPGFTDVVAGTAGLRDTVSRINLSATGGGWLQVIPSGPCPPNPAELLSSGSTSRFFEAVSTHADVVLIDTPAMLVLADAAVVMTHADTAVVVTSARLSRRRTLQRCIDRVVASSTPILGLVLNAAPRRETSHAGYGYGYGYGQSSQSGRLPWRRLKQRHTSSGPRS